MNEYIVTFHSHFGALSYRKYLEKQGIVIELMPVPRKISSSCGTCARYTHSHAIEAPGCDLDAIYLLADHKLECVFRADESE